jgi:hypothetical protein
MVARNVLPWWPHSTFLDPAPPRLQPNRTPNLWIENRSVGSNNRPRQKISGNKICVYYWGFQRRDLTRNMCRCLYNNALWAVASGPKRTLLYLTLSLTTAESICFYLHYTNSCFWHEDNCNRAGDDRWVVFRSCRALVKQAAARCCISSPFVV